MITSSILLIFLGSFALYNTSKNVELSSNTLLEKWFQQHTLYSKICGVFLLIATLIMVIFNFGITSGIIFWHIALMSILSLLVIISPLQKVNYKHFIALFLLLIILEFFL